MATTGSYKNIQVPSDKIRHVKAFGKIPLTWVKMNLLLMFTLEGAKLVSTRYNRPGASNQLASWISQKNGTLANVYIVVWDSYGANNNSYCILGQEIW